MWLILMTNNLMLREISIKSYSKIFLIIRLPIKKHSLSLQSQNGNKNKLIK